MQHTKGDHKQQLLTIQEVPQEENKQKEGFKSLQDNNYDQSVDQNEEQQYIGQSVQEDKYEDSYMYSQNNQSHLNNDEQMLLNDESSLYYDPQIKFTRLEQQAIADQIDELNIMKKGFKKIFKQLGGLQSSISMLPDKMGQTFEHMKAVLDRRYQAMLKAFMNAQSKIRDYSIKLRNMETKIGMSQTLKCLQKECMIYREFSELLTKDMEKLTVEIIEEEKKLSTIHSLYEIRKEKLTALNEQNLYLSGVITRVQKQIKRYYKRKRMEGQQPRYQHFYFKNFDDVQRIERICGASKVKSFKSTNRNFGSNMNSKKSQYSSQHHLSQSLQKKDIQIDVQKEGYMQGNEFQYPNFSIQNNQFPNQFSTTSHVKFSQSENNKNDHQMRQTAFSKPSSNENEVMGSTQMTFKRQITPQVKILNQNQTNDLFFSHQRHPQLKQTFFSKTDQLFMKKPKIVLAQAKLKTYDQESDKLQQQQKYNYIVLNEQNIHENKIELQLNLPQKFETLQFAKEIKTQQKNQSEEIIQQNIKQNIQQFIKEREQNNSAENIQNLQNANIQINSNQLEIKDSLKNKFNSLNDLEYQNQYQQEQIDKDYDEEDMEEQQNQLQEEDYIRLIEEVDRQTHNLKHKNQNLKKIMINRCNQFYSRFNLLKTSLSNYKNYLEQNQKITSSKEGLHGSLLFEMSKLNKVQSQPVLHEFNKQSYKPSQIMDRESKMVIHDTLKQMLDKQIQEKQKQLAEQKKIDKKIFINFTPIQLIGMMSLKTSSFVDFQFIMERKARMIEDKLSHSKILSSTLYQLIQDQF